MKKLLALLLALIMCLTVLTSCDAVMGVVDQIKDKIKDIINPQPPIEYQIDKAEAFLKNMYKDVNPVTGADYEVVGQIRVANVAYTVTWASNSEQVKIVALENGNYLVDLNEKATEDTPYTLTATITAGNGETATVVYERTVPKYNVLSWDDYMKAVKGDVVLVEGIVVAMNGKSVGNSRNHLFLADASGKGGYYSYQMPDDYDPVAAGVKVGMTVSVSGEVSPYSGMQEIYGGTFTIVDETIKPVTPVDITDFILAGNTDFSEYVALPVTIKGVTIGSQELETASSQYLNFEIAGLKSYVRTYVTDFPTTLDAKTATADNADKAAIDKAHADHFGYTADVTGILILYSGNPYLIPMTTDCFTNFTAVERTAEEKIAAELDGISLPANVGNATVVELPLVGANYTDVTISWTSDSANAVVGTDGKLTISLADEATTVTLTATLTCGDKTVTETFEIAVAARPSTVNVVVDAPVVGEEYYFMSYQANLGRNLYITGEMDGYYFATTSDVEAAVKVKVVDAGEGKYDLMVGDKYLGIVASGTYINVKYLDEAPENKFVWNTEYKTFTTTVNDTEYYFGTYNTFETFSASKLSYAATSFVAHLIVVKNVGANVVDTPVAGNEYYFMTKQENLNKDLFITGEMNGYYFATTTDVTAAAKVKVVDAGEGKYDLMVGDKYLAIVASGTYINVKYLDEAPENKFTWNTEYKTFVTVVNDTEYYFGTYNTFETFSASKLSYAATSFVAHLVEWVEDPNATPETPAHECESVCDTCGKCTDATCTETVCAEKCEGHETTDEPVVEVRDGNYTVSAHNANSTLYFDGTVTSGRFNGVTSESGAAVVTVKTVDGGYILSVGTQYIVMEDKAAGCGFTADASAATVFVWNDTLNTYVVADPDNARAFGCQDTSTYSNFSAYAISNTTGYNWGVFTKVEGTVTPGEPVVPAHECESVCDTCGKCTDATCTESVCASKCEGHEVVTPNGVVDPVVGTAYAFGMVQGNVGKTYYLKGGMNGYYLETTENVNESLHVYIEATEGGYYLYCYVGTTKTYINCVVSGTHVNGAYEATASTVYTYDATSKTLIADVDGTDYWFGTRNDKTYTTVGPCAVSYAGFYCQFYTVETSEEPVVPTHECESECDECGKCTDAACTETVCAEKCEGHESTPVVPGTSYSKATSVAVGDQIVIVYEAANAELSGVNASSIGTYVTYTDAPTGAYVITLEAGSQEGTFAMKTPDGKYLYATNANKLHAKSGTVDDTMSWTITFDADGNAIITNVSLTNRVLQWNINADQERFCCYKNTMKSVQIYK